MKSIKAPMLNILEPGAQLARGLPLLRLGFRPFYLCAALFAAISIPVWVLVFLGQLPWRPALAPLWWHAHEMIFGFATAVIIGFLMTAGKAWTGQATPRGKPLGALVLLWLAARLTALTGPYALYVVLDVALLPLIALVLIRLLLRAGNKRNLPLAGLLILLALSNLAFHLGVIGWLDYPATSALHAALALIVMIECVMGARVIPGFTMSANPGLKIAPLPGLLRATLGSTGLGLLLWVFVAPNALSAAILASAAGLHLASQWRWHPQATKSRPILWILHAAYAWIPLSLGLLALAQVGLVSNSAGIHGLAVGATGGLIIGMITRTARGHTGRTLQATSMEVLAYALVLGAAVLRVLLPLLAPHLMQAALISAAMAWSVAFILYLWRYTPWLMQARVDGLDG